MTTYIFQDDIPATFPVPSVVFSMVSGWNEHAMGADPGVEHSRFQFTSRDDNPLGAKVLDAQVRAAISRWQSSTANPTVQDCFVDNRFSGWEYVGETDRKVYFRDTDIIVHHGSE